MQDAAGKARARAGPSTLGSPSAQAAAGGGGGDDPVLRGGGVLGGGGVWAGLEGGVGPPVLGS